MVEDIQETRQAIAALLAKDGYCVNAAQGEEDAIERARWNPPDLVLISLGGTSHQVVTIARRIRTKARLRRKAETVALFFLSLRSKPPVRIVARSRFSA